MTDRINLTQLRAAASDPRGFTWKRCGPEVLALIDAVEAAHAHIHVDARHPEQRTETREHLRKALDRFNHT